MSSSAPSELPGGRRRDLDLDLERDLPTTVEDVQIQRRLRHRRLSAREFAAFLARLGPRSRDELWARRGPCGEPFEL